METLQIAHIRTASIQLVDVGSGTVLTTAPLYRCSNRLLATVKFPKATVKYVVVGTDINGVPFTASLSKSAQFVPGTGDLCHTPEVTYWGSAMSYFHWAVGNYQ